MRALRLILLAVLMVGMPWKAAADSVSWNIALSTTGQDVLWTSPTALATGFPEYDWSYEITKVTANTILGNQDLLSLLESTTGGGTAFGLPITVVDSILSEPTTGSTAHIAIEVGADGIGRASATDITLGSLGILRIRRVDFEATVTAIGIPSGDYDRNGVVDANDYQIWHDNVGSTIELAADGNRNNVVDAADYTVWRDNLAAPATAGARAIPEPTGLLLLFVAAAAALAYPGRSMGESRRIRY